MRGVCVLAEWALRYGLRDDDPRSTKIDTESEIHDAHRETVEAAAARIAPWRLIATCAAVPTACCCCC
jgi:hypothetical protein